MATGTALQSGFTRVVAQPSVMFAEIAWRWALGAAVSVLLFVAAAEYLNSISVIGPEPFAGLGTHFLRLLAVSLAGIVLLASLATAAGRNAVLATLFADPRVSHFSALLWLSFLRAVLLIAALLSLAGVWLIASLSSGSSHRFLVLPDAAGFWLVFCPLALLAFVAWAWLYWIVTLAPLPAVADHLGPGHALARAVGLIHDHPGELAAVGIIFGVLRLGSLGLALQAGVMLTSLSRNSPATAWGLLAVVAAAYFLFSDYLYVSRIGTYAALIQNSEFRY